MRKKSERQKWIEKCEDIIRELKFRTFGRKCQICGREKGLGLFHILAKGGHPRIRLHEDNMIIACWMPCHYNFHHDYYYARDIIVPRLKELCGENYEEDLREIERNEPKLSLQRIKEIYEELKEKL